MRRNALSNSVRQTACGSIAVVWILNGHYLFSDVQLIVGDYELEDAAELANLSKSCVNTCVITAGTKSQFCDRIISPEIELEIRSYSLSLALSDGDNVKLIGIKQKINEVIKKRTGIIRRVLSSYFVGGACVGLALITAWLLTFAWNPKPHTLTHTIIKILVWVLPVLAFRLPLKNGGVYTIESTSTTGWWNRNKDSITVGLLLAVIAAILGVLFTSAFTGK